MNSKRLKTTCSRRKYLPINWLFFYETIYHQIQLYFISDKDDFNSSNASNDVPISNSQWVCMELLRQMCPWTKIVHASEYHNRTPGLQTIFTNEISVFVIRVQRHLLVLALTTRAHVCNDMWPNVELYQLFESDARWRCDAKNALATFTLRLIRCWRWQMSLISISWDTSQDIDF